MTAGDRLLIVVHRKTEAVYSSISMASIRLGSRKQHDDPRGEVAVHLPPGRALPWPRRQARRRRRRDGRLVRELRVQAAGEPAAFCACGIKRRQYEKLRSVRLDRPSPEVPAEVATPEILGPVK
jgi:hypothetical protein